MRGFIELTLQNGKTVMMCVNNIVAYFPSAEFTAVEYGRSYLLVKETVEEITALIKKEEAE